MIRKQGSDDRLFYTYAEIVKPSVGNFYTRLDEVVGDWDVLSRPFRRAFSEADR